MFRNFLRRHRDRLLIGIFENLKYGELVLTLPDGNQRHFAAKLPGPSADLQIHTYHAVSRILSDGKIGFCEAFMDDQVSSDNLPNLIELAARHDEYFDEKLKTEENGRPATSRGRRPRSIWCALWLNKQSKVTVTYSSS